MLWSEAISNFIEAYREKTSLKNIDDVKTFLPDDKKLTSMVDSAKLEVESIIKENKELSMFRGKEILKQFYEKHMKPLGFSYYTFCIELAKQIAHTEKYRENIKKIVDEINSK